MVNILQLHASHAILKYKIFNALDLVFHYLKDYDFALTFQGMPN